MTQHDWTATLEARARGERLGFLAHDIPLEEQDPVNGGPLLPPPTAAPVLPPPTAAPVRLDALTKAQLLERAAQIGVPVDEALTKAQLIAAIESA